MPISWWLRHWNPQRSLRDDPGLRCSVFSSPTTTLTPSRCTYESEQERAPLPASALAPGCSELRPGSKLVSAKASPITSWNTVVTKSRPSVPFAPAGMPINQRFCDLDHEIKSLTASCSFSFIWVVVSTLDLSVDTLGCRVTRLSEWELRFSIAEMVAVCAATVSSIFFFFGELLGLEPWQYLGR